MLTKKMIIPRNPRRILPWGLVSGLALTVTSLYALNEPITHTINLEIADGQGGALLPKEEEEDPGAFTVANKNDTDGDGTADSGDNDVGGEIDLMELKLNPPVPNDNPEAVITLTLPGNAKLFKSSDKKAGQQTELTWKAKDLPKSYWVELQDSSSSVRSETFTLTGSGATDSVNATGVWAEKTNVLITGAAPGDLDEASLQAAVTQLGLGVLTFNGNHPHMGAVSGRQTGILYEFKVKPPSIGNEAKVKFDLTRQAESRAASYPPGGPNWIQGPQKNFPAGDIPNDDAGNTDEDATPKNDHIYAGDWPGALSPDPTAVGTAGLARGNFLDFVRVKVGKNATRPSTYVNSSGNTVNPGQEGSRASNKELWFFKLWWEKAAAGVQDEPGKMNVVTPGSHDPVTNG